MDSKDDDLILNSAAKDILRDSYVNELTKELDTYVIIGFKEFYTYIYKIKNNDKYLIRYPGATRGHIEVDSNNIIIDIVLYEEAAFDVNMGCYLKTAKKILKKYIGMILKFV